MATVKFLLNRPNDASGKEKKTPVAILARVSINRSQRFVLTTKETILPKYWTGQRAKANMTGSVELNLSLGRIENDILQLWRENKSLSINDLKEKARVIIQYGSGSAPVQKKSNDLELFIEDFIKRCLDGRILRKPNTIRSYNTTLRSLRDFSDYSGRALSFDAINLDWYYEFRDWCWDVEDDEETRKIKRKQGIRPKEVMIDSTVGKMIKDVKTFMREAYDMEMHNNLSFKKKQFQKLDGETDSIYLSQDEILTVYNLDLSQHPHLIESRDLFVFDCWVGLRYSDLTRIKPEHVNGNTIRIRTQKTGEDVVIPFHPIAQAIFSKYGNALPEAKANANFNYDLKAIGEAAGITERVQRRDTVRGITDVEWVPKWKLLTAHTARRSFATNCYKMGVPTRSVMAITGHKTEKAFNKYIKLNKEEHAQIMLEHFNKSIMKIA